MLAEGLRARQAGARASVLTAVVASATTRVTPAASSLSRIVVGTPASIEGVACVMVAAETFMQQDSGVWPTTLLCLVDRHILVGSL